MVGKGGQQETGYTFHKDTGSSPVPSPSDINEYNSQYRLRVETAVGSSLASHISLLIPPIGSTGPVVHLHGLTVLEKASRERKHMYLAIYTHTARV